MWIRTESEEFYFWHDEGNRKDFWITELEGLEGFFIEMGTITKKSDFSIPRLFIAGGIKTIEEAKKILKAIMEEIIKTHTFALITKVIEVKEIIEKIRKENETL